MHAHHTLLVVFTALVTVFSGCGPAEEQDVLGATEATLGNDAVTVLDSGHWSQILACSGHCYSRYHFWVDLRVRNDAFNKQIGIRWTDNGWASAKVAYAKYEETLPDGFERWGIDVTIGEGVVRPAEIEFAAFAEMNGTTSWDPHNNHAIYKSVLPHRPVTLVHSKVEYLAGTGAQVSGTIRAYNLDGARDVAVRYSTDGWQNSNEAQATFVSGHDWTFTTPSLGNASLPEEVQFAVRYRVGGNEYWDNNNGQNYKYRLAPQFVPSHDDLSKPVSGILTWSGGFMTDLAVQGHRARLDSGAWTDGNILTFSTLPLADGTHSATFEVTLQGGYSTSQTVSFTARNRVQPTGAWALTLPNPVHTSGYPWDAEIDGAGRVYVLWDDYTVQRYDTYGTASAPFNIATVGSAMGVTVDASDRVYVLAPFGVAPGVHRFLSSGQVDTSWGQQGVMDLNGVYDEATICYPGFFAAVGNELLLSDTCNSRILRFDAQGAFVDALWLDSVHGIAAGLHWDAAANTVYIGQERRITAIGLGSGTMQEAWHLDLPQGTIGMVQGLSRSADGSFWVLDSSNRLLVFDANGNALTIWNGGSVDTFVGAFPLGRALVSLQDGSFAVLSVDAHRFERFSPTLR
ncbi:MAG: hypothetical protein WBV82_16395 [Myxococcaceae bacterium]